MSSNLKVLVADDNPDHVQLITEILNQELKAEVEGVTEGEECLKKVKKTRYDLLLLDYLFPKISGLDVLKEIVEEGYDLPVIMITGHGSEKVAVEAMKAGAIDYIVKSEDGFQSLPFVAKKAIEKDQLRKRLRQSEEKFQNLFESANDAIIYLDKSGRILEVNKQAVDMFGGLKEEMLGKHFTRLGIFPPGEIPALPNNFADILAGKGATVGVCIKNKKDQEIALECSASLMKTDDKVTGVMVIARDVTERKRVEEALRESEEKWRSLVKNAPNMIIIVNRDSTIQFINCTVSPLTIEETIGKSIYDYIETEYHNVVRETIEHVFQTGQPGRYEIRGVGPHGYSSWYETQVGPIKHDEQIVAVTLITTDITERKRAEESLKESEERYKFLYEESQAINLVIGMDGKIMDLNKYAVELLGYDKKDIIGKDAIEFVALEQRETIAKQLAQELKGEQTPQVYVDVIGKEAIRTLLFAEGHGTIFEKGKPVGILLSAIDITEKKKMEAQLIQSERLAAVGTLSYGIAHEFNNILAGILGNAEFGMGNDDPQEMKECFQIIMESCDRAKSITKSLLAFSRQRETKKQRADVTSAVETILGLVERELEKHNIKVVRKFSPVPQIVCDLGELSGVVLNMITNARDSMRAKGGTLTIEIEKKGDNIEIIFTDSGCGIPDSIKVRIFEPFVTTKGALGQSEIPGTGLGLFLSYGIIKRYDGEIGVKSEVGKGSTFTIRIPISKNQLSPDLVEAEEEKPVAVPQNLNILLVDDEQAICSAIKRVFERKGHSVTTALSGKKGLEIFKKGSFDLVLTDITMPDMDGLELISKLKKIDPQLKFIVLTGHIAEEKLEKAKKAGAHEVLVKPFGNEELYQAVGRLFST